MEAAAVSAQQFCLRYPSLPILSVWAVSQSFPYVEHSSVEVLGCKLKLIYISSWLALRGRVEFAVCTWLWSCALCRSSPPWRRQKHEQCDSQKQHSLLGFPYKNRAGGYFRELSSGWLQPVEPTFSSPALFNSNWEIRVCFPSWIFPPLWGWASILIISSPAETSSRRDRSLQDTIQDYTNCAADLEAQNLISGFFIKRDLPPPNC